MPSAAAATRPRSLIRGGPPANREENGAVLTGLFNFHRSAGCPAENLGRVHAFRFGGRLGERSPNAGGGHVTYGLRSERKIIREVQHAVIVDFLVIKSAPPRSRSGFLLRARVRGGRRG